jgi:nuclear pore complex protein Nup88
VSLRTITASPSLELTASLFELNRSGTYAAVAGSALEDPEISRVVVVDLANCRPAPASSSGSSGGGRHDMCDAVVLDPELFASRPGLRVLQMGWHPDSECHLAVLTSDNTWRLYNTQRAALAEQTFELQLRGRCLAAA